MIPRVYMECVQSLVALRARKAEKDVARLQKLSAADDARAVGICCDIERRVALANESMDFLDHVAKGGTLVEFASRLGWIAPVACKAGESLSGIACRWINDRWA